MLRLHDLPRRLAAGGGLFLWLSLASAPSAGAQDSLFRESRPAMGTTVDVLLYADGRTRAAELFDAAFEEIERVEQALSGYRATSEISRINAAAARGPVVTDPEMFGLVARALDHGRRSDGAFDITVGALVTAWGFFRAGGRFPSPEELARARGAVGWHYVVLDPERRSIRFAAPGIELDLGGIGKGFALDRAARILRRHGVTAALLGAGQSSYYAVGAPPGTEGWPIVVSDPRVAGTALSRVVLRDRSLSTSGSGEQFFELDGVRYSHLIDPRTGEPVRGMLQVTVTTPSAADSDALATALFVTGPEGAAQLLGQYPDAGAILIADHGPEEPVVAIGWSGSLASRQP
jgi:thiamine biosynthesis lipoprotein